MFTSRDSAKTSSNTQANMQMLLARVTHVILDDSNQELYEKYGYEASIGGIVTVLVDSTTTQPIFALPLFPNFQHIPVEEELLFLIRSYTPNLVDNDFASAQYYYLPPINLWSNSQHNAAPNFFQVDPKATQKVNFQNALLGQQPNVDEETKVEFKNNFKEKSTILPLQPFAGDVYLQGRWNNTIRLGSTNLKTNAPWSTTGTDGDSIIILSNNKDNIGDTFLPIVEQINQDKSSIYLTTTQKIDLQTPKFSTTSYTSQPPTQPNQFIDSQVVLSADRILAASKTDSILLTAAKDVHVSANNFHVDVDGEMNVYATKIVLGDPSLTLVTQPVLKGDDTEQLLKTIIELLQKLTVACSTATGTIPIASLNQFAIDNAKLVATLNTNTIKSKDVFVI